MSIGSWSNQDGLLLQFGTQKAASEQAGDFLSYGDTREAELRIDLTSLTTIPVVQSLTTFLPAGTNMMIEQVDVYTDVGQTGNSSALTVGLGYIATPYTGTYVNVTQFGNLMSLPAVTAISTSALVTSMAVASFTTAGQKTVLNEGTAPAGAYIGSFSTNTTNPTYITAQAQTGTYTAGTVRLRIRYRGIGTISQ
jgi:hypothetical protein